MAYNGAGIYGIFNIIENKIYIGSSSHIQTRFYQHHANFRNKSDANQMYKEPEEHFVYMVLHKLSDQDFQNYGDIFERLYIIQARESKIEVYNRLLIDDDITWLIRYRFEIDSNLNNAIYEHCKRKPWHINKMTEHSRKALCEEIRTS